MPLPAHPGLPGSRVIPDGWAPAHAGVVTRTLDCTITIAPPGGTPAFNPETRRTETVPATPSYAGPASIGLASVGGVTEDRRVEAADDDVDIRAYRLRLPAGQGADVTVDQVITVVTSPTGALDGMRLLVTGVALPGREFSRAITARLYT